MNSLPDGLKDGFTVTPGWAAVLLTAFLAWAAAGLWGLRTSTENATEIRAVKTEVAYIRARIDMALDRR